MASGGRGEGGRSWTTLQTVISKNVFRVKWLVRFYGVLLRDAKTCTNVQCIREHELHCTMCIQVWLNLYFPFQLLKYSIYLCAFFLYLAYLALYRVEPLLFTNLTGFVIHVKWLQQHCNFPLELIKHSIKLLYSSSGDSYTSVGLKYHNNPRIQSSGGGTDDFVQNIVGEDLK